MPDSREAQGELLEERSSELRQFIPDKAEPLKRTRDTLAVIAWTARDYQRQLEEISRDRQSLRNALQCVSRALTRIPQAVSQQLATGSPHFTLERDVLLCEVRDEARRRTGLITKDYYSPCLNAGPGFEGDMQELENRLSQLRERLDFAGRTLAEIPAVLPELYGSPSPDPKVYSPRAWAQEVAEFRDNVATLREVQDELEQQLDDLELEIQELRDDHDLFLAGLSSPAMQLQRFNFSPLGNKKSITFTIRRGVAREEDGGSGAIPARVNSLELKSAPVYSVQFGMGLVATGLESPTFKVANVPAAAGGEGSDEGGEGEGNEPRQILLYDDRGDGKVLPGLFIHHHWLRRSPLLRPTWFELFTPTFSLGIPVAEAEALQQIFLGLNWELVTGMDVNVGYHFGRVKSLAQGSGIRVGEPLPPGFDMSSAQRDDFDSAFYFGIVLNSEAFKFLTNGAED